MRGPIGKQGEREVDEKSQSMACTSFFSAGPPEVRMCCFSNLVICISRLHEGSLGTEVVVTDGLRSHLIPPI